MNFDLSEEQQILRDSARSFLAKECPSSFVRKMEEDEQGFTWELWQKMAELGWIGLMVPEDYGGSGMSFLDLAVLLTEMGYTCLPGPFFPTGVLGVMALLDGGSEAQKRALLPEVAAGKRILTLAWTELQASYSPEGISMKAEAIGGRYSLTGTKLFVPDAHVADTIICVARIGESGDPREGLSLLLVDGKSEGLEVQLLKTMAGDKACEVSFRGVEVPRENLLGEPGEAWPVLRGILLKGAVAKCAEMCGGAQRVLELALTNARERVQFGRPIGAFQAVQHHCANMLTYLDTSRFMTYQAAWRISEGLPYEREASMCKAWVGDSYRRLVALGHQVLGGIGFTEEHDMQLYFKRSNASELLFGSADFHRELVAQQMGM